MPALSPAAMDPSQIERLIDQKIRSHELRIAVLSGIPGCLLLFGIFHAIWLLR